MTRNDAPHCKKLVLDAGPLLSLSPLRGLAETYVTVPQVLAELKDSRAREHFERLGLLSGVKVEVRSPDAASLAYVIQWAKKTGDYSVLSHPDLCVLALTYLLKEEEKNQTQKEKGGAATAPTSAEADSDAIVENAVDPTTQTATVEVEDLADQMEEATLQDGAEQENLEQENLESEHQKEDIPVHVDETAQNEESMEPLEPLDVEITPLASEQTEQPISSSTAANRTSPTPLYDDPSDEDDGEGEWITPHNVGLHKSRALDLLPQDGTDRKGKKVMIIGSGCMTADFAMQNVLLQMGLNLVGLEGQRIERIKSWVLRCHACFKICKDNSKKFCPSCGNPTLLRASVTVSAPGAAANSPVMQVHLKPNFQYKTRGTKYSIPAPKAGSAKTGAGTGLILREDQVEYMRAKKRADGKREREEERLMKGIMGRGVDSRGGVSSWMDPDWVPEIISVGSGGRGRTSHNSKMDGDMPQIGYGRKNPNEKRRKK
ncbi:hypothetical protein HYPSUDRAFT_31838 [Hypholoma sublateritium FD-334 SS-4]|uniref:20S-pre-rRNA D-site endonuclease NOB1 n=1 Tax=Hypholoma sublateritium (strain FD-334 SS-4) TaxID=945553 RepID=A0A0D2N0C6_HYPSF|nr:hypothetical protein HYPSUDRAFT_31838 [Hypholoma sublateritium FD-334 SS-4]